MITLSPWVKLPSSILHDPKIGELSDKAFRALILSLIISGAYSSDDELNSKKLSWLIRVDQSAIEETIQFGLINISESELTMGNAMVVAPRGSFASKRNESNQNGPLSSTERSRKSREAKKAATLQNAACNVATTNATLQNAACNVATTNATLQNAACNVAATTTEVRSKNTEKTTTTPLQAVAKKEGVTPTATTCGGGNFEKIVEHQKPTLGEMANEIPQQLGAELIFPAKLSEEERKSASILLAGISPETAQAILDELSGQIQAGIEIKNLVGWIRAISAKAKQGQFTPERGSFIKANRESALKRQQIIKNQQIVINQKSQSVEESIASIKPKNPKLANLLAGIGEKLKTRARNDIHTHQVA